MQITININTKGASFDDFYEQECENVARLFLQAILSQKNKTLIDLNGNTIGSIIVKN